MPPLKSGLINLVLYVVREISGNFDLHAGNMKSNTKKEGRITSSLSWDATQPSLAVTDVSELAMKMGTLCCPKNQ